MDRKNISALLSNYHLVVPEIQREYVWGDPRNRPVITQFLRDINDKALKGDVNVGFLYSYQSGNEHYLIDGQQRYTTLVVLLYYLSLDRDEDHQRFLELLNLESVSPAFAYRVRSHTDSFLTNLFKSTAKTATDIKNQKWYKSEYETDKTIGSIIGAIDTLSNISGELTGLTFHAVLDRIYFWYFDVAQTSQGEELYITMNSRGEKLTDSEQIKPRLLNRVHGIFLKEEYGKKWDNWEEFFYDTKLRKRRPVKAIDDAMNNLVRVALEMVSLGEHDQIKPVEDAEREDFDLSVIESYMDAIVTVQSLSYGRYQKEVERLYGDAEEDRNFYVLKTLITEVMKGQKDSFEFERVYHTIANQVRRNKIKSHIDFLQFLHDYRESGLGFYDFIINGQNAFAQKIFNGHELEKIVICHNAKEHNVEKTIWEVQESTHWKGEIKSLLNWSKVDDRFSFKEFVHVRNLFDRLFDQKEGWTRDIVRQALIASKLPHYPNGEKFGFYEEEWKEIFLLNSKEFKNFLDSFDGVSDIDAKLKEIKSAYPETSENPWAEFVHHDALLNYCDTKHLYWLDRRGWMLVQRSWAHPFAVKDQLLYEVITNRYSEDSLHGWTVNPYINWSSCVYFQNSQQVFFDIRTVRHSNDTYSFQIELSQRGTSVDKPVEREVLTPFIPEGSEPAWNEDEQRFIFAADSYEGVFKFIDHCLAR